MTDPQYLPTTDEGKITRLAEECAEVIKEICKYQRFGPDGDAWVQEAPGRKTPRERLAEEIKDLMDAIADVVPIVAPKETR